MGASAYIGRVGGLAVALGIGAAVATGHGVAWATPTDPGPSTNESASNADTNDGQQTETSTDGSGSNSSTSSGTSSATSDPGTQPKTPSLTKLQSRVDSVLTRAAERGVALTTGGALSSSKFTPAKKAAADQNAAPTKTPAENNVAAAQSNNNNNNAAANNNKRLDVAVHRPAAPAPTVDVRTVEAATAGAAKSAKAVEAVVQNTADAVQQKTTQALSAASVIVDNVPVMTAASEVTAEQPTLPRVLTNLVSAFGLGSLASGTPAGPIGSPIALALLALGVRRESEVAATSTAGRAGTSGGSTPVAALALTPTPTAAVATPSDPSTSYVVTPKAVSPNTSIITKLTGPGGLNNTPARFGVGGTDLGIMWDNGITDDPNTAVNEHQVLILFGDTFSNSTPVRTGVWRNNMLFRSSDNILSNGVYVRDGSVPVDGTNLDDFSGAPLVYNTELGRNIFKQVIANERYSVGQDVTIIPTSAISVPYPNEYGSRQYASFMDVRSWDSPGRWTTNYSGIAFSDDNGVTWHVARESIRPGAPGRSTEPYVAGDENFQQMAFVAPPEGSPDAAAGYVYAYGTPSGRGGTVYLSRVKQEDILDQTKYEYWDGAKWVPNQPSAAKPILPATTTTSFFGLIKKTTYPSVGEMSVQYNEYEKQYIMLYQDGNNNIVMRKADRPEGPWSPPIVLVPASKMPGLYAPMIHPWSSTEYVPESDRQYLYWNVSTWGDYEVTTMRTDLSKV